MSDIVLGIDPGTATTGYGFVQQVGSSLKPVAYGVVSTSAKMPMHERLQIIYRELDELIKEYKPVSAGIEKLFFSKNVTTGITVAQARGVAILAMADNGLAPGEYTPMQIKQSVCGYGGAKKPQIQQMVKTLLGLQKIPRPDDAADGLAVAICHLHSMQTNYLMRNV